MSGIIEALAAIVIFTCATLCKILTCCLWFAVSSCSSVCLISLVPPTPRLWLLLHHCRMPLSSSTRSLGPRCCSSTQRTRLRIYKDRLKEVQATTSADHLRRIWCSQHENHGYDDFNEAWAKAQLTLACPTQSSPL